MNDKVSMILIPFKEGDPGILFNIGSFPVRAYSVLLMIGIIASILTVLFFWLRENYKLDILMTLIIIIVPLSIVGARLGYVFEALIYDPDPFKDSHWYAAWDGGLSIQGGVILGACSGLIYGWYKRDVVDFRKILSFIIPTILIGQFVGRWGNFTNHEVYGKIDWDGSAVKVWGSVIANNMFISDQYSAKLGLNGAYRYPLFLYEALANLFAYLVIVWIFNLFGLFKPGTHAGMYFLWYGLVRYSMEPLRQEAFSLYSNVALVFIFFGAFWIIYFQFISKVEYIVTKEKYRYVYTYKDELKYQKYVAKTSPKAAINWLKTKLTANEI
ncbi:MULTISPECIES: prolipoprotein diacylglyceryl transferase [unclassified Mycoplasma]|uniref:prolipoprotein diacylglyceryl transferase n=1 Tax=unclassified Mycoplasma TaxID=2683645 RepID=UPI00211CE368|nr:MULTISPECIES: prolipoprotein diacylglyceryl transferase [unclassified Mycoplasma]UUM19760.1 prolipoprotein diacylglyceryl transferase [Mycoplasma sp. 1578d]UUM24743.1 prolipoprotein diacylglyceryl transferase [Mycoplasma sp. 3686d]